MHRRRSSTRVLLTLFLIAATLGPLAGTTSAVTHTSESLFADLCGDVGGRDALVPGYPGRPSPTGNGVVVNIENSGDLDDLLAGRLSMPPPGSVISLASGVYSEARWKSTGGAGIGFAGTAAHPITWYSRQQYGVEITVSSSYRAMQLNNADAHHRFIGFHLRDSHELFLSEASGTEFLHGRISGSTSGGAWKWRGVTGGPTAVGMAFKYNVVSTANTGSNFSRLEGVYIGDGRNPQLLTTRQTNFEISDNCFSNAPGGAIDVKANSTNGIISNNLIDSTDDISGGINALPGWHWLSSSVRSVDPNVRSVGNRISVRAHPDSSDSNAGAGIRVNGTWRSTNDVIFDSSNSGLFVLAQADLNLTVTGLVSSNNINGAARRGGSAQILLESSDNRIDRQGSLVLNEAQTPPTTAAPTTTQRPTTTRRPTTLPVGTTESTSSPATSVEPPSSTQGPKPTTVPEQDVQPSTTQPATANGPSPVRSSPSTTGTDIAERGRPTPGVPDDSVAPPAQAGPGSPVSAVAPSSSDTVPYGAGIEGPSDADTPPPAVLPLTGRSAGSTLEEPNISLDPSFAAMRSQDKWPREPEEPAVQQTQANSTSLETASGLAMVEIDDRSGSSGFPAKRASTLAVLAFVVAAATVRRRHDFR